MLAAPTRNQSQGVCCPIESVSPSKLAVAEASHTMLAAPSVNFFTAVRSTELNLGDEKPARTMHARIHGRCVRTPCKCITQSLHRPRPGCIASEQRVHVTTQNQGWAGGVSHDSQSGRAMCRSAWPSLRAAQALILPVSVSQKHVPSLTVAKL